MPWKKIFGNLGKLVMLMFFNFILIQITVNTFLMLMLMLMHDLKPCLHYLQVIFQSLMLRLIHC